MAEVRARKLRLTAPSRPLLRRGADALENVLRTASLGEGSRVYVVRRFSIGEVVPGRPVRRLADGVSRRFAALRSRAVHGSAAGAGAAEVVWFRDDTEALLLLGQRLLAGGRAHEWFWSLLLRGLGRAATPRAQILLVIEALARGRDAPAALPALLALAAERHHRELLEVLAVADVRPLLAALGLPATPDLVGETAVAASRGTRPPRPAVTRERALLLASRPLLEAARSRFGPRDPRPLWLAAVTVLQRAPALVARPALLLERARAILVALDREEAPVLPEAAPLPVDRPRAAPPAPPDPAVRRAEPTAAPAERRPAPEAIVAAVSPESAPTGAPPSRSAPPAPVAVVERVPEHHPAPRPIDPPAPPIIDRREGEMVAACAPAADPWPLDGLATDGGGLLFLLPVLRALGMEEFLVRTPGALEAGFPARLLLEIARRSGLGPDDPLAEALAALFPDPLPIDAPWCAPRAWSPFAGVGRRRRWRAQGDPLDAWILVCRRWCRRRAGLGLSWLVRRPGRVSASATHIDVTFSLADASAAVRLAGLDLDPGWVPWLGRVVLFHYRSHDAPAA